MAENKKVICHDRNGKLYKVDSKKLIFRPSIYGILIEKNKVLLSKQWDGYDFPGGGAELHETIDDTLIREFWEETGLLVKSKKIIYVGTSLYYADSVKKYWNCQLMFFAVKKISGKLSKENLDKYEKKYADLPKWIEINKLDRIIFHNSLGNKGSIKLIKQAIEKYEK